jgi:mannosyltransferase
VIDAPRPAAVAVPSPRRFTWRPTATRTLLALTVFAAVLRFATLDVQSLWLDESATMILVHRGLFGMLSHLSSSESAPPLYYVLVWAWTKLFGAGALGFRSLSAVAGTLTVPVLYAAGRRVSPRVGLWAAALAAVNPAMYYYSQEARCYALLILFGAVAFVAWQRALEAPSRRRLALWAGISILALLTHYFAAFLFIAEAFVLVRRLGLRPVAAPAGAVVLVGLALLPLAVSQREGGRKAGWIEAASLPSRAGETAKLFLVGVYGPLEILSALLAGLFSIGALALLLRCADERALRAARNAAVVAALAIAFPLLGAVSGVLDVFDGRNAIAVWVPWALLLAIGLGAGRARLAGALLGAGLCAVSVAVIAGINAVPAYQRDDWRGAARALSAMPAAPGASAMSATPVTPATGRVVVGEANAVLPLSIYLPDLRPAGGSTLSTRELDFLALRSRGAGGGAPLPAVVPTRPPPGFRLAGVRRTETYALSRFIAPRPLAVPIELLRRESGDPSAEVIAQRLPRSG